jgi:hypothetical protein
MDGRIRELQGALSKVRKQIREWHDDPQNWRTEKLPNTGTIIPGEVHKHEEEITLRRMITEGDGFITVDSGKLMEQPQWQKGLQIEAENVGIHERSLREAFTRICYELNGGKPDGIWCAFRRGNRWFWGSSKCMPEINSADANPEPQTASDSAKPVAQFDTGSLLEMSAVKQVVSLGKMSDEQLATVSADLDIRMHAIWGKEEISDREGKLADRFEQLLDLINAELERRHPAANDDDDVAELIVEPTPLWKSRDVWQYFPLWKPESRRARIAQIEAQTNWRDDPDMTECWQALQSTDVSDETATDRTDA